MKTKTIVAISVLLASCAAVAADSPFEKGKTYTLFVSSGSAETYEVKDVKGKWLLVNGKSCEMAFQSNECWISSDQINMASQAK